MHIGSIQARHTSGSVGGQQIDEFRRHCQLASVCSNMAQKQSFCFEQRRAQASGTRPGDHFEIRRERVRHERNMPWPDHRGLGGKSSVLRRRGGSSVWNAASRAWKTRGTITTIFSLLRSSATLCVQMIFERQRRTRRKSAAVTERIRSTQEFVLQNMRSVRHKSSSKAK